MGGGEKRKVKKLGGQNQNLEAPPKSRSKKKEGSKEMCSEKQLPEKR